MRTAKLLRFAAVVATGVGLSTGVVAANSGSIGTTGPNSRNQIVSRTDWSNRVSNRNDVGVTNNNPQQATSGDATTRHNTTAGSATTGTAHNDSLLRASLTIRNNGAVNNAPSNSGNSSSIRDTGPDSVNRILNKVVSDNSVCNSNEISVTNNNKQNAKSGDARVSGNTTGGSARSGDASNISTAEVTLNITN